VDQRDDARLEELNNLRLALATFALHLDTFEMQVTEATSGLSPIGSARPRDIAARLQKESRIGRR
jgi:hypothetical protein